MTTVAVIVMVVSVGIVLGSLPVANLIANFYEDLDLRSVGDRNPGFWNAYQQLGLRRSWPVFVGDVAKGAAAAGIGAGLADTGQWWMAYVGTGAAMVGHAFPMFSGWRGGRSVLAFVGGAAVFSSLAVLVAVGVLVVVWALSTHFEWAARVGIASFPVAQFVIEGPERTAVTGILMTLIGVRFVQASLSGRRRGHARSSRA